MTRATRTRAVSPPKWRDSKALVSMQAALAAEFGLARGTVDAARLDYGLERPRALMAGGVMDPPRLAASYCAAIARTRPFPAGNLALALMAAYVILRLGGYRLTAPEVEAVAVIRDLASGAVAEAGVAAWLEQNAAPG